MLSAEHEQVFQSFIDAGNEVIGRPVRIQGRFTIPEMGSGSRIVFGSNVTISNTSLHFPVGGGSLEIGDDVVFKSVAHLGNKSRISVGAQSRFNREVILHAWEDASIEIGLKCLLSNVVVRTSDMHSIFDKRSGKRINPARSVVIEDNVWVGESATILKGSRIGAGSVIGIRSLVTGYIPPRCIAAGAPARVLKKNITWTRQLSPLDPLPAVGITVPKKGLLDRILFWRK